MKAKILYNRLENDFISSELSDIWAKYMVPVYDFLTENFKVRSMGRKENELKVAKRDVKIIKEILHAAGIFANEIVSNVREIAL